MPKHFGNMDPISSKDIPTVPIKYRIPSATLRVNEMIKLDQAMMMHKILNEQ